MSKRPRKLSVTQQIMQEVGARLEEKIILTTKHIDNSIDTVTGTFNIAGKPMIAVIMNLVAVWKSLKRMQIH